MQVQIGRYMNDEDPEDWERNEHVVIHKYDTWNMDHTLALIVLPMLKQLKQEKHGAPNVDDDDVPAELMAKYADEKGNPSRGETDSNWFKRWDWVLDEMIYAFDCKANKDEPYVRFNDMKEAKIEQARITNGFRLFGKYYESLWD
jgi:hypothetical protein